MEATKKSWDGDHKVYSFWRPGNNVIKDHGTQKDDKATKVQSNKF